MITKHWKSKSPLQPSSSYSMFDILLNLSILTTIRAKVSKRLWHLLSFNSHKSCISLFIPNEIAICVLCLCTTYIKALDFKASYHPSSFEFTPSLDPSTNTTFVK